MSLVAGYNWWLPPGTLRTANAGRAWMTSAATAITAANADGFSSTDGPRYAVTAGATWATVHTGSGVFDWSSVDAIVASVEAQPAAVGFHLWPWCGIRSHVPKWVKDTCVCTRSALNAYYTFWDASNTMTAPLFAFVTAMVSRYINHPRLVYIDARAPIQYGGEWVVEVADRTDDFYDWAVAYHQCYADAAGDNAAKIVSTLNTENGAVAYRFKDILTAAYAMGIGQRDGSPSHMRLESHYGMTLTVQNVPTKPKQTQHGWWVMPDSAPLADGRVSYSEATEFDMDSDDWGPPEETPLRFRSALLWALTVRRNWVALGRAGVITAHPDLVAWLYLQLGKTITTAQDAWFSCQTAFGETAANLQYIHGYGQRWLNRIEVSPGGVAVVDDDAGQPALWLYTTNYLSYRTDIGTDNDSIYFRLDPDFIGSETHWQIQVTYLDSTDAEWHVEYETAGGTATTRTVVGGSSGNTYTAAFYVAGFAPAQGLAGSTDFRIVSSVADVHVLFVRIIKLSTLRADTTWRGYMVLENIALDAGQWAALLAGFQGTGPTTDSFPAYRTHWRLSGNGQKLMIEARYASSDVMVYSTKALLATAIEADASTIGETETDASGNAIIVFDNGTDLAQLTVLGGYESTYAVSHTNAMAYQQANTAHFK